MAAPSTSAKVSRRNPRILTLQDVSTPIPVAAICYQRPMSIACREIARVRCSAVPGFAVKRVGAIAMDFQHPRSALELEFPNANDTGVDLSRFCRRRVARDHRVLAQGAWVDAWR